MVEGRVRCGTPTLLTGRAKNGRKQVPRDARNDNQKSKTKAKQNESGRLCWSLPLVCCVLIQGLADVFGPVFEVLVEVGHELAGVGSVDDAVIEAEGEALDPADGDGVVAVLVGEDHGFLVETADAEDGCLRLSDDRGAELLAEDAGVGEGEGAAGDFVGSELLVAGAVGDIDDGASDAEEVLLFGLLDDRDDEAPVERNGDADVDVLVVEDRFALDGGVDDGVLAQRFDGGAGDEGHEGQLHAVALLVLVLFLLAQLHDAGHVDAEGGVNVRRSRLRLSR